MPPFFQNSRGFNPRCTGTTAMVSQSWARRARGLRSSWRFTLQARSAFIFQDPPDFEVGFTGGVVRLEITR